MTWSSFSIFSFWAPIGTYKFGLSQHDGKPWIFAHLGDDGAIVRLGRKQLVDQPLHLTAQDLLYLLLVGIFGRICRHVCSLVQDNSARLTGLTRFPCWCFFAWNSLKLHASLWVWHSWITNFLRTVPESGRNDPQSAPIARQTWGQQHSCFNPTDGATVA